MSYVGGFWAAVEMLVALDRFRARPFIEKDVVEDWLDDLANKLKLQPKYNSENQSRDGDSESSYDCSLADYGNLVDCSFSHSGVKTRLELLMGSNVVRLTDRKYMTRLVSKIREEHERKQETRIEDRKMRELMRTKDMVLKRFISTQEAPAEIRQYPLFKLYSYCDSIIDQHRAKDTSKKVKITASLYRMLYPHPSSENFEAEEGHEDVPLKEVLIDGQPVMVPMTKEEIEQQRKQQEAANDIKNGYMFTKEEYESLNYEADAVKKLKEVKTVNEMYKKAHDIVGFLISFSPKEKRKTCAMDADPSTSSSSAVVSAASASGASVKSRH